MKKNRFVIFTLVLAFLFSLNTFANDNKIVSEVKKLEKQKKYSQAIKILDKEILKQKKPIKLLGIKVRIQLKMKHYQNAVNTSIEAWNISNRKSPWKCINIVSIYLKLKDIDKAYIWLNKAVKYGFLSYSALYDEEFKLLKKDKRFKLIIKKIKTEIGIGKLAKQFTTKSISGKKISLLKLKGKVILIDFWAVWCSPCVKGIPHLKELYKKYKDKDFEIIGINLDEKIEVLNKYIAKKKIPWEIIHSGKAWLDDIAKLYKVNLIPSYWLIDKKGILRDFGLRLRNKKKLKDAIEKLL
jgi:thiol-disulfide isomerase/thioredoxin